MCGYRSGPLPKSWAARDPLIRSLEEMTKTAIRQRARELEHRLQMYVKFFPIDRLMLRRWIVNGEEVRTDVVVGEGPRGL